MNELLLGIDIGTGSCKCCLADNDGNIVGRAVREYSPSLPKPGWVEQQPSDWYEAVVSCLQQMEARTGIHAQQVCAVSVTGQMRGVTFLDNKGDPVRPSILWNDQRCELEATELRGNYAGLLQRITCNPMNTMCTLPKLLWVQRHEPETWQKTATILYPKDYINFRLTGMRGTDHSDASGSSFYNLEGQTWSDEILEQWNLPKEKLPEIHPSTVIIGSISSQAHYETGLRKGIPVASGGSDATVELLAIGLVNERQCKIRLGTSGALSTVVYRLDGQGNTGFYIWSYIQPGCWMIDINTRACADATVWLKNVFYAEMGSSEEAYKKIGQEAGSVPVGADGLFFHPYLLGEDAPYWQPHLRASFFGLSKAHQRPQCARAVLEGTGFALRDARLALGELANGFEEYIFVGGGTRNVVWMGIVADILGVDGKIAGDADAALGAAMLAGVVSGVFTGISQAIEKCSHINTIIRHSPENHEAYDKLFDKYVRIKHVFDAAY
jgi:xylulokinase